MDWTELQPTLGLLRAKASEHPDRPLLVGPKSYLTYSAANSLADSLAETLRAEYGLGREDRLVCASTNGPAFFLLMAATQRIGAIFVPIKARRAAGRLPEVVAHCKPKLTVSTSDTFAVSGVDVTLQYNHNVDAPTCEIVDVRRQRSITIPNEPAAVGRLAGPPTEVAPAMIMYTSGSTGASRGIVISHANQRAALWSIEKYLSLSTGSQILSGLSPAFDYGLYQYFIAVATSGTLGFYRDAVIGEDLRDELDRHTATVLPLLPTTIRRLRSIIGNNGPVYPEIEVVTSTGSVLDEGSISFLIETFPRARIYSMYGLTECKRVSYLDPEHLRSKPGSVGQPMSNCEVRLLDQDGNDVAPGNVGELFVAGPNVACGYWGDPDATAATFRRSPQDCTVILATGDLFVKDSDGDLYFKGRRDDLVKINDQRVSLVEVERIARTVVGVVDAVAFVDDGTEVASLVVYVEASEGASLDEIRSRIRRLAPSSAMKPRQVYIVDNLRETETGKLSRQQRRPENPH